MVNKNQNSTPILESNWGLRALNQGNILPSLPQTPHSLRVPLPPLVVGPAFLAQGELQGLGDWAGVGKVPLSLVKTSLPELASLLPAPYPPTPNYHHEPGET